MGLLYTGNFDGFGERKTPNAFVQACDMFIYTEVLRAEAAPGGSSKTVYVHTLR